MAPAASTTENELVKEQSLVELGATTVDKPQKSENSKPKETTKQVHIKEKKVKPRTKPAPKRKSNKKGMVKLTEKLVQGKNHNTQPKRPTLPEKKSARRRKKNARFQAKKKSPLNLHINGDGEGNMSNRRDKSQSRLIPLVLPSSKPRGSIVRSSVKYTLQRAESNRDHHMRMLSNKRRFGRRKKPAMRKRHFRRKYFAEYWREPEVRLDELSSLDCGSYSDYVKELSTTEEAEEVEDLFSVTIPSDFVFNINAPEFIPKGANKRTNSFTLSELVESLKGQHLPSMPNLRSSYLLA